MGDAASVAIRPAPGRLVIQCLPFESLAGVGDPTANPMFQQESQSTRSLALRVGILIRSTKCTMSDHPQYVCAILEDAEGRLLLESRPDDARLAAGRLTCFGGRREAGESPEACLRRELREELNWEPTTIKKLVELRVAGALVAWFYHAALDVGVDQLQIAAGYQALLISAHNLPDHRVSPWHAAVLRAWLAGETLVELDA